MDNSGKCDNFKFPKYKWVKAKMRQGQIFTKKRLHRLMERQNIILNIIDRILY